MAAVHILYQFTPRENGETALAVTEVDLETANRWLDLMNEAEETITASDEFSQIVHPHAPLSLYMWPRGNLPSEPQYLGFVETATMDAARCCGVQVPGPLPMPDLDIWKPVHRTTSIHIDDGVPVLEWLVEPEYFPGFYHAGGLTRNELLRIRRKLQCYNAKPDEQRQLFRTIENNDPHLAREMVTDCELLRASLTSPDALLRPEATGGRVQSLRPEDVEPLLKEADSDARKSVLRWLGTQTFDLAL